MLGPNVENEMDDENLMLALHNLLESVEITRALYRRMVFEEVVA